LRKKQIDELDNLTKSRFVEMFGDPISNSKGWAKKELNQCLINIENGKSFVCDTRSREGIYPAVLKLSAATYGEYKPAENKAVTQELMFTKKTEVKAGDLLFTRKNTPDLVGMCAYVYSTAPNLMMPDLIFRLNTNDLCNKIYLWKLINLDRFRIKITDLASGSAKSMSNISKERLMKLVIPVPPIEKQLKFADFVQQVDKQKFEVQKAINETEELLNSLIQKYFK